MKILMVASEAAPFLKVGGLADAVGGLGRALASAGHKVAWCLPRHRHLSREALGGSLGEIRLPVALAGAGGAVVERVEAPGGRLFLVDAPGRFDREGLYGEPGTGEDHQDNAVRFAILSEAACRIARHPSGFRPDVIHCHDHHAALVPALLRHGPEELKSGPRLPVVFSIHNLEHQGICDPGLAGPLGLEPHLMHSMGALEYYGRLNPVKGAILLADRILTVSPTYAEEILGPDRGAGLDGVLRTRSRVLEGILNGIDTAVWNPAADPLIPHPYSASSLEGKARNRRALLEAAGLQPARAGTLAVGMVSRLVEQKGIGLLLGCLPRLMDEDVRLVVLGMGDPRLEEALAAAAARYPGRMAFLGAFDERMAHLIEAGSSLFLMPSIYEPCGLNQMYSMRYGAVPLARATGGLADTVVDLDEDPEAANGFVFRAPLPVELLKTVRRALRAYRNRRLWRSLMLRGMERDLSWGRAARAYQEVYRKAMAEASGAGGDAQAREERR